MQIVHGLFLFRGKVYTFFLYRKIVYKSFARVYVKVLCRISTYNDLFVVV